MSELVAAQPSQRRFRQLLQVSVGSHAMQVVSSTSSKDAADNRKFQEILNSRAPFFS